MTLTLRRGLIDYLVCGYTSTSVIKLAMLSTLFLFPLLPVDYGKTKSLKNAT